MATPASQDIKYENIDALSAYQQNPSLELRNKIVKSNIGLVRKEAHHWMHQCSEGYDDLLQVGCIGLIRAIERFELGKGHAFSSFAIPYIRGEIQHYLRDRSNTVRIPRRWLTIQRQAESTIRDLQIKLNRYPKDLEIAEAMGLSVAEWHDVKLASKNRSLLSLDAPVTDEGEQATSLGELVPDHRYRSFQLAMEDQIRLQQALVNLEDRTRKVLEFVFLYDLTQKETAERMGISAVTVSRQVKKGLERLKKVMMTEI
ncbi:RNA polymerase sigma factor SigF [Roseofilum reptotaenium CS-1145]|uniref:RNA polymerase subunit sigma n=1 Tax=Roseofilum reptotaenium AO1-A TaxID=1925591 RepID=A0A1L9QNM4_9CYAN|nr:MULTISPECIES: RNA polymerase sigma factor SigF [Roseofilum]MBP0029973.1 RNA polymerase sigma factor SigF [Roseofilum sp. Guam]MDB9517595.1 RNA polymerase sigma factor SigF [Roseofilum reptotaenium CS-1145]OJJ24283.1 RNA polymerase subunit sigma [Roseofilum reptotaenium AO1-A]